MDASKLHLLLNHYPVIVMIVGVTILLTGIWRKNSRAILFSFKLFFAAALIVLPVYVAGEMAGGSAGKTYFGAHAEALNTHKSSARTAFILMEFTGLVSLIALIFNLRNRAIPDRLVWVLLVLSLASCGLIGYTTHLGRQVKWADVGSCVRFPAQSQMNIFDLKTKRNNMEMKLWHA